jgi:general secretion pathway protein A
MNHKLFHLPHLEALGLEFNPFPVVPDENNYFTTEIMNSAISDILHCIDARKGFVLISGEVGLGKTTLSRLLLHKLAEKKISTALVFNSFLQSASLLKAINKDLHIKTNSDLIEDQIDALNEFLLEQYANNRNCVIIIDDAQQLNFESLEIIRQLSNLETNENKLVQIILVAQGEILNTLSRHELRQLKSRIALNIHINPLTIKELKKYVRFRLARAGSSGQIDLNNKAYEYLHKISGGLPRQINLIMDRCLYVVAAYGINIIDKNLLKTAYDEIRVESIEPTHETNWLKRLSIAAVIFLIVSSVYFVKDYDLSSLIKSTDQQLLVEQPQQTKLIHNQTDIHYLLGNDEQINQENSTTTLATDNLDQASNKEQITFLNQFGLTGYANEFNQAITSKDFLQLSQLVRDNSAYILLLGQSNINHLHTDLLWSVEGIEPIKWITFWEPEFLIESFYQNFYSESILQLQTNLKEIGFYTSRLDGFVGNKTILAVSNLQTVLGINPTGLPDYETLFQIQKIVEFKRANQVKENQVVYLEQKKTKLDSEDNK